MKIFVYKLDSTFEEFDSKLQRLVFGDVESWNQENQDDRKYIYMGDSFLPEGKQINQDTGEIEDIEKEEKKETRKSMTLEELRKFKLRELKFSFVSDIEWTDIEETRYTKRSAMDYENLEKRWKGVLSYYHESALEYEDKKKKLKEAKTKAELEAIEYLPDHSLLIDQILAL